MLEIKNIGIRLGDFSLSDISLTVNRGDYLTLLGVSGAGKTVLLEVLAGLVKPSQGSIVWDGRDITGEKIQKRPIGLVYQDLSLFPHMRVDQNIAFPLRLRGLTKTEIRDRVLSLAETTGIPHLLHRYPGTLSGGEAQRVALARTLAADPDILLLDEPLANLDVALRSGLTKLLRTINRSGKTIIHVTHDYAEAATLSNKIAVIEHGRLVQTGDAKEVFRHPATAFVAQFSGMKNIFSCTLTDSNTEGGLKIAKVARDCHIAVITDADADQGYISIPSSDILVSEKPLEASAINQFSGAITETWEAGPGVEIVVDAGAEFVALLSKTSYQKLQLKTGKKVWITFKASSVRFLSR